ncbi:MAG: DUF2141 domain-containing protein [Candidatus Kapaibacteriota bacterium]
MKGVLILVMFMTTPVLLFSKNNPDSLYSLTIKIEDIHSNQGNIRVHLYDVNNQEAFPTKSILANHLKIGEIRNNSSIVTFEALPPGIYAFTVHHDENLNEKMDRNFLGMPTEGWALSNNIKPLLQLPTFQKCCFNLKDNKKVIIKINY